MANILVTGGAGYVGSVCCAELLRLGRSLVVVDDLSTGFREAVPREAVFYRENVADTRALRTVFSENRIDAVLHFAAKALVLESVTNLGIFFEQNVAWGIAFLEAVRAAGGQEVCLFFFRCRLRSTSEGSHPRRGRKNSVQCLWGNQVDAGASLALVRLGLWLERSGFALLQCRRSNGHQW